MKRRGFLGIFAGAAVAGPAVAKNAVASISTKPITGGVGMLGGLASDCTTGFPEPDGYYAKEKSTYLVQRANELRRLISGEEDPGDKYEAQRLRQQQLEPAIHCLGSVSHTHKVRMVLRANRRLEKELQRRSWMEELLNLERMT